MFDLDVFIPTLKQRTDNMTCQVQTALNSGLNVRVTASLPDADYPELMDRLTPSQQEKIRFIPNVAQGNPSTPIKYCLENIEWSDWIYMPADDDCLLPWGLPHLWEAREGVSTVIGQVLGVSRTRHFDLSSWKLGPAIIPCHVSGAGTLFNMRSLDKLEKPWCTIHPLSDFHLIKRMTDTFKFRIIPSVVAVVAFAELENLGQQFSSEFQMQYGHLL